MKFEGLLPTGSVVMLEGGNHRLMIIGYAQKMDGSEKAYDYVGCLWPEGYLRPDANYMFNQENVKEVFFLGYQTDGEQVLVAEISAALDKYRAEHPEAL